MTDVNTSNHYTPKEIKAWAEDNRRESIALAAAILKRFELRIANEGKLSIEDLEAQCLDAERLAELVEQRLGVMRGDLQISHVSAEETEG